MKIRRNLFNIYLPMVLLAAAVVCGCHSDGDKQSKKLLSTLRLHMQVTRDSTKSSESVPIYREKPIWVDVTKEPLLTEAQISAATVADEVGGFVLRIQFDHAGATMLEELTVENRGRRIAIFSQWGEGLKDFRWLAAPMINHPITDGVLTFTPDTTRQEADDIALGLNHVSKKVHSWIDR